MRRVSLGLWLALAGAVLQFVALGSNWYKYKGEAQDAWFGVPHTSELILAAALVTVVTVILSAANRTPLRGRTMGLVVGGLGTLATLQLAYRMVAPPFQFQLSGRETLRLTGSCLVYCSPGSAANAKLLTGIWIALVGCILVTLGGFLHAVLRPARETRANFWAADRHGGMTPWLGLAALGAVGQFVLGYTFFTFYTTKAQGGGSIRWSGWLPTPHTSAVVLWITLLVIGLTVATARGRTPVGPAALGGLIAVLGFVSASRIFLRILQPPFASSDVVVGVAAYLALASALLIVLAGIGQAVTHRTGVEEDEGVTSPDSVRTAAGRA